MTEQYIGIDYSMGASNVDRQTGIHYGIISVHDLSEFAWERFEPDYGPATCPKCGEDAVDAEEIDAEELDGYKQGPGCTDYACKACKCSFDYSDAFGEEPLTYSYEGDGYVLEIDSSNDVWILKSPYYTYAAFCSPCAPGAGHLGTPLPAESGAPKVYCLDASWFRGDEAPYTLYPVAQQEEN